MFKVKRQIVVEVCIMIALVCLVVLAFAITGRAFNDEKELKPLPSTTTTAMATTTKSATKKATTTKVTTTVTAAKAKTKKAVAKTTAKTTTTVATTTAPTETTTTTTTTAAPYWDGEVLTPSNGRIEGPSGQETFYNLDMSGVLNIMYGMGFSGDYWIRNDGCKMFGDYIMVAADLSIRPRGSIVQTSLGYGIVCDTGSFIYSNPYQLDIATCW